MERKILPCSLSLIPSVFESFLSKVEGFQLPDSIDDYSEAMKELDLGEKQLAIADKLLFLGAEDLYNNSEIPSFDQLMSVIEAIAYYFIPPSLKSKHNPMCGMRDVIQKQSFYGRSRNHDQIIRTENPKTQRA